MALEAKLSHSFGPSTWVNTEKLVKTSSGFLRVSEICKDKRNLQMSVSRQLPETNMSSPVSDVSCSYNNYSASAMKPGYFPISLDDSLILKNKGEEIGPYLYGRCIYLVGMMGSGKTTVGRILADVLGYSFLDCDVLVEQAVGGHSVAEIFKLYGEDFFRDTETEVLLKLSPTKKFVVSTGGGAVLRPINWKHMRSGISIWLDIPLEALAQRITSVGTDSRPLLHEGTEDDRSRIFRRLTAIMEKRAQAYTNANARVSLDFIAAKHGYKDVLNLSPAAIAIEALDQIESFVKDDGFAI